MRLVARGFERTVSTDTDFFAGTPKLTTVRALLTIAAIQGNPMPSESEPVYVEPAPGSRVGLFQGMALQERFSRTQDFSRGLGSSQHTENQRHELQPLDIFRRTI